MSEEYSVHPNYLALVNPIKGDSPVGAYPCKHKDYEKVADQLKKIGTLYHDHIQWHDVEKQSLYLLEHECKDIVLFTGFILAQLNDQENSPLFLILTIIDGFIGAWGDIAHPSIETVKGQRLWSNRLGQIGRRLKQIVDKRFFTDSEKVHLDLCEKLLETLQQHENINASELVPSLRNLQDKLKALAEPISASPESATTRISRTTALENQPLAINNAAMTTGYELDSKEIRSHCQDLIRHQSSINAYNPIVYRLRRYMIWGNIDSLPDANEEGKTELFAPPTDLRSDYQQQLNKHIDDVYWQRLETSLENSPYWISGHHLSYQYALKLNQPLIAEAIREETRSFVNDFADISKLSFADKGTTVCFLDKACQEWLHKTDDKVIEDQDDKAKEEDGTHQEAEPQWIIDSPLPEALSEAVQTALKEENLKSALQRLEKYLQQTLEPRSQFYAQLVQAEVYEKADLHTLAHQHYQQLWQQLQTHHDLLEQWEPRLLHHLKVKQRQQGEVSSQWIELPSSMKVEGGKKESEG